MRVEDYYPEGKSWWLRLHEKGGKRREMPALHKLEAFIDEYIAAAGIRGEGKSLLFRTAFGRTGRLGDAAMHRIDDGRKRLSSLANPSRKPPAFLYPSSTPEPAR